MNKKELAAKLSENGISVFTTDMAARVLGKSNGYASNFLENNDFVTKIERGKYFLNGSGIYSIASHVVDRSYLSMRSAFRFYNLTTQMPNRVEIVADRQHKRLSVLGYSLNFRTIKKELLFGYRNVGGVIVAEPEKAFLDAIYFTKSADYLSEEFDAAMERGRMDIGRLKSYALKMENRNLVSVLGFFLERRGTNAVELVDYKSNVYVRLNKRGKHRDARWSVIW